MLLGIDIGNTNIVFGVYEDKNIVDYWRINSDHDKTADEYGILFREAIRVAGSVGKIENVIMSSVVPPLTTILKRMVKRYFKLDTVVVDENIKTGLTICYDNPGDVGADRIVNAVAAYAIYGGPVIIVDFGTATTFCVVSSKSEYIGGVIVPGVMISLDALSHKAAKLPSVTLEAPAKVIGRSTVTSIQSGIVYGYAGLVDELVERMKKEIDGEPYIVATGGLAEMIASQTRNIKEINPMLTLEGLRLVFEMNIERGD